MARKPKPKQKIDETLVLCVPAVFAEKVKNRDLEQVLIGNTGVGWVVSAVYEDGRKVYLSTCWRANLRLFKSLDTCLDDLQSMGITKAMLSFGNFTKKVIVQKVKK